MREFSSREKFLTRRVAERGEEVERLKAAGDRIVALISRCSDQATDDQRDEHNRFAAAIERIWSEAKNLR